jgi:hypothetical protein
MFMPYIDQCAVTERTEVSMTREIHYGSLKVKDHVSMVHFEHVHYQVPPQDAIPSSSLRMSIEEPEPNRLFVRFCYEDEVNTTENAETEMLDQYRRSAYLAADIDTIRMIRELAEGGLLNALIN